MAAHACTLARLAKNILVGAYTFKDLLVERATGEALYVNGPHLAADRKSAKYLEFWATFRAITIKPSLVGTPKSFVKAVRLPLDEDTGLAMENLATKDFWTSTPLMMANILHLTAAPLELLELAKLQNGQLKIKEQTIAAFMT